MFSSMGSQYVHCYWKKIGERKIKKKNTWNSLISGVASWRRPFFGLFLGVKWEMVQPSVTLETRRTLSGVTTSFDNADLSCSVLCTTTFWSEDPLVIHMQPSLLRTRDFEHRVVLFTTLCPNSVISPWSGTRRHTNERACPYSSWISPSF